MSDADADALLVERVKRGDVRAFEMLVVKYQRRVQRLIGRMVRDVDLVQDISQETFIRAYRALPQFRGDSAFYTWLYRIAVEPSVERAIAAELRERAVGADEGLLRDVLDQVHVAHHAAE